MKKKIAILIAVILAVSLLSACGASFDGAWNSGSSGSAPNAAPMPSSAPGSSQYSMFEVDDYSSSFGGVSMPMDMDMERWESYGDDGIDDMQDMSGDSSEPAFAGMAEKIIYTAYADIETVDFDESIERVYDLLGLNRAFIESSYIGGRNYSQSYYGYQTHRSANFTLRIPKDRFEAVTSGLGVLGNVTSLRTDAQNITSQFIDTESRLSSYKIQEERLLAMLEKADNVTDMISIEARLADIRYSIESLTSTLTNWQSQVDYSTLTLHIYEVERFTEIVPIQRTYWQQVGDGLRSRTRGVGEFFKDLFKWVVVNLPVFVILAIIAIAVVIIVRRKLRKRRGGGTP